MNSTLFTRARKAWAALAAGSAVMVAAGLITGAAEAWVTGAVAAVTAALSVYAAPANDVAPGDVPGMVL